MLGQKNEVLTVIGRQVVIVREKIEVVAEIGVIAGVGTIIDTMTEIMDMTVSEIEIQIILAVMIPGAILAVMIPGADEGHDLVRGIVEEIMIDTGTN